MVKGLWWLRVRVVGMGGWLGGGGGVVEVVGFVVGEGRRDKGGGG